MHTVKPLDTDAVLRAARATGALVTAEEHSIIGGLGGAVAEAVTDHYPVPLKRVGIADRFAETGPYDALLDRYGMAVNDVLQAARRRGGQIIADSSTSRTPNVVHHSLSCLPQEGQGDAEIAENRIMKTSASSASLR